MSKCRESSTLKSVCSNTVEYGVSNYSLEFERLRKQVKIAERLTQRDSLECMSEISNTQVPYIVMNSQKAPQTVEVSRQQYTGMNVGVLVIWRHTDGTGSTTSPSLMYEREETLSSHNDMCQRLEGYRSQYSDKESGANGESTTP